MDKVTVVYWSQSGNTQAMAEAVGEGIKEAGKEAEVISVDAAAFVSGKKIGLFGSYGWGVGQWMRDWEERMKAAGAEIVTGAGVICNDAPDDEAVASCKNLGKELVALA